MRAKNETAEDCFLIDSSIYFDLLDSLYVSGCKLNEIRKLAEGWSQLNGPMKGVGTQLLRILDNQT